MAPTPATAITGTRVGLICDRCNRGIRSGDPARFYATRYEGEGWRLRRVHCAHCGEATVEPTTATADEVVGEAVWIEHRLASVRITDRSRPEEAPGQ